ncbi:hypothetical protein BLNAU_22389 [Blattamonas nauphoetae]|uniref:Uncharacterized protein n=1 Tax=Blattamonas nauphoetae TaxID=2049346 RepID=A0ABQ9WT71_9EUKA|nr:hypothetical protein BLNAU_22389 [Blattamonas nauphoetae]
MKWRIKLSKGENDTAWVMIGIGWIELQDSRLILDIDQDTAQGQPLSYSIAFRDPTNLLSLEGDLHILWTHTVTQTSHSICFLVREGRDAIWDAITISKVPQSDSLPAIAVETLPSFIAYVQSNHFTPSLTFNLISQLTTSTYLDSFLTFHSEHLSRVLAHSLVAGASRLDQAEDKYTSDLFNLPPDTSIDEFQLLQYMRALREVCGAWTLCEQSNRDVGNHDPTVVDSQAILKTFINHNTLADLENILRKIQTTFGEGTRETRAQKREIRQAVITALLTIMEVDPSCIIQFCLSQLMTNHTFLHFVTFSSIKETDNGTRLQMLDILLRLLSHIAHNMDTLPPLDPTASASVTFKTLFFSHFIPVLTQPITIRSSHIDKHTLISSLRRKRTHRQALQELLTQQQSFAQVISASIASPHPVPVAPLDEVLPVCPVCQSLVPLFPNRASLVPVFVCVRDVLVLFPEETIIFFAKSLFLQRSLVFLFTVQPSQYPSVIPLFIIETVQQVLELACNAPIGEAVQLLTSLFSDVSTTTNNTRPLPNIPFVLFLFLLHTGGGLGQGRGELVRDTLFLSGIHAALGLLVPSDSERNEQLSFEKDIGSSFESYSSMGLEGSGRGSSVESTRSILISRWFVEPLQSEPDKTWSWTEDAKRKDFGDAASVASTSTFSNSSIFHPTGEELGEVVKHVSGIPSIKALLFELIDCCSASPLAKHRTRNFIEFDTSSHFNEGANNSSSVQPSSLAESSTMGHLPQIISIGPQSHSSHSTSSPFLSSLISDINDDDGGMRSLPVSMTHFSFSSPPNELKDGNAFTSASHTTKHPPKADEPVTPIIFPFYQPPTSPTNRPKSSDPDEAAPLNIFETAVSLRTHKASRNTHSLQGTNGVIEKGSADTFEVPHAVHRLTPTFSNPNASKMQNLFSPSFGDSSVSNSVSPFSHPLTISPSPTPTTPNPGQPQSTTRRSFDDGLIVAIPIENKDYVKEVPSFSGDLSVRYRRDLIDSSPSPILFDHSSISPAPLPPPIITRNPTSPRRISVGSTKLHAPYAEVPPHLPQPDLVSRQKSLPTFRESVGGTMIANGNDGMPNPSNRSNVVRNRPSLQSSNILLVAPTTKFPFPELPVPQSAITSSSHSIKTFGPTLTPSPSLESVDSSFSLIDTNDMESSLSSHTPDFSPPPDHHVRARRSIRSHSDLLSPLSEHTPMDEVTFVVPDPHKARPNRSGSGQSISDDANARPIAVWRGSSSGSTTSRVSRPYPENLSVGSSHSLLRSPSLSSRSSFSHSLSSQVVPIPTRAMYVNGVGLRDTGLIGGTPPPFLSHSKLESASMGRGSISIASIDSNDDSSGGKPGSDGTPMEGYHSFSHPHDHTPVSSRRGTPDSNRNRSAHLYLPKPHTGLTPVIGLSNPSYSILYPDPPSHSPSDSSPPNSTSGTPVHPLRIGTEDTPSPFRLPVSTTYRVPFHGSHHTPDNSGFSFCDSPGSPTPHTTNSFTVRRHLSHNTSHLFSDPSFQIHDISPHRPLMFSPDSVQSSDESTSSVQQSQLHTPAVSSDLADLGSAMGEMVEVSVTSNSPFSLGHSPLPRSFSHTYMFGVQFLPDIYPDNTSENESPGPLLFPSALQSEGYEHNIED